MSKSRIPNEIKELTERVIHPDINRVIGRTIARYENGEIDGEKLRISIEVLFEVGYKLEEKAFKSKCPYCFKEFDKEGGLNIHLALMHGIKKSN